MKLTQFLNKTLEYKQSEQQSKTDTKLSNIFKQTHFYCEWSNIENCNENTPKCYNHLMGLPKNKDGKTNKLFDYQHQLFKVLQRRKMVFLLKATGLGITEFMIRYIGWLSLKDNSLQNTDVIIVTGPRLELSITIIDRLKKLFINYLPTFDTRSTTVVLNQVTIKAYPSNHLSDIRGIVQPSFIFVDEAAFFQPAEQENLRDTIERYQIKSSPWIVMTSTPNKTNDIMQRIMLEENSLYERLYFSYKVGVGKMWTEQEIEQQKRSPSFEREYNLSFEHNVGNIYNYQDIEQAQDDTYSLAEAEVTSPNYWRAMSIDPAFGTSELGIIIIQKKNGKLEVVYADTISRPSISEAIEHFQGLIDKFPNIKKVLIDSSEPGLIKELKLLYEDLYPNYYTMKPNLVEKFITMSGVWVCPINFAKKRKEMLRHSNYLLSKHYIRIDKSFNKFMTGLRSAATTTNDLDYDKQASSYSDLVDCFLMLSLLVTQDT